MAHKNFKEGLPLDSRQLEMISRYYPVDTEEKVVTFSFRYKNVDEILTPDVRTLREISHVDSSVIEKMGSFISFLPQDYSAVFDFEFDDYMGYDPGAVIDAFNDAIELNHYSGLKKSRGQWLKASILMGVGCIVLLLMCMGQIHDWFGEGTMKDMVVEIIDIIAWVFIWESVSMAFLEPSENVALDVTMKTRVRKIRLYDKDKKNLLAEESQKNILSEWKKKEKSRSAGYLFLLFGSAGFLTLSVSTLIMGLPKIVQDSMETPWLAAVDVLILFVISACYFLAGVSGINFYLGKEKFVRFRKLFITLSVLAMIGNFAYAIVKGETVGFLSPAFSTVAVFLFVFGFLILHLKENKKD